MSDRRYLRMLPPPRSAETKERLRELQAEADLGDPPLIGFAYVAIYPQAFYVDAVGAANDRATLTRGAIHALDDLMRDRQRRGYK